MMNYFIELVGDVPLLKKKILYSLRPRKNFPISLWPTVLLSSFVMILLIHFTHNKS